MGAVLPPPPRLSGTDGAERGRAARSTRSSQPPPGEPRLCLRPVSPGAAGGLGLTPWGGGEWVTVLCAASVPSEAG